MNADFRKGWRAACAAVAQSLIDQIPLYQAVGSEAADLVRRVFEAQAPIIEATPPPKTMTVVDENGERLL